MRNEIEEFKKVEEEIQELLKPKKPKPEEIENDEDFSFDDGEDPFFETSPIYWPDNVIGFPSPPITDEEWEEVFYRPDVCEVIDIKTKEVKRYRMSHNLDFRKGIYDDDDEFLGGKFDE